MIEQSKITHSLIVEVRDYHGNLKEERYIKDGIEFLPNKIHTWLRNRGHIKSNTFKIPFLLGTRKRQER